MNLCHVAQSRAMIGKHDLEHLESHRVALGFSTLDSGAPLFLPLAFWALLACLVGHGCLRHFSLLVNMVLSLALPLTIWSLKTRSWLCLQWSVVSPVSIRPAQSAGDQSIVLRDSLGLRISFGEGLCGARGCDARASGRHSFTALCRGFRPSTRRGEDEVLFLGIGGSFPHRGGPRTARDRFRSEADQRSAQGRVARAPAVPGGSASDCGTRAV